MVGFAPDAARFFWFWFSTLAMASYISGLYLFTAMSGIGMLLAAFLGLSGFVASGSMVLPSHLAPEFHYFS